jgi:hypothetical protein
MKFMIDKTSVAPSDSADQLKNIFEQSLAVLSQESHAPTGELQKIRRSLPLHTTAADLQKRAIDNAANALASLWKISGPARVKPRTA